MYVYIYIYIYMSRPQGSGGAVGTRVRIILCIISTTYVFRNPPKSTICPFPFQVLFFVSSEFLRCRLLKHLPTDPGFLNVRK